VKFLILTPYLYGTAAGPRSSIELWERVLEPEGITFEYASFEDQRLHDVIYQPGQTATKTWEVLKALSRRIPAMGALDRVDGVLVYREAALIGPAVIERWVARKGLPIIYQLDDPLYVPYRSPSNGYLSYLKVFGKVAKICRLSKVVIANSRQHVEYATRFNAEVRQIPSIVDGDRYTYRPTERDPSKPVCVGWSGSPSTAPNLKEIQQVLSGLGSRDDVRLHFIGSDSFDLPGVRHTAQEWRPETEIEDLRQLDVGLLPLPVDEWTKRKFYLKLVQYMALGIPAVCAPLGSNPDVIEHGATGYLADSPGEWRDGIERLVGDPELRQKMGRRAAKIAHQRYTLQANKEEIVDAFRSALS
jgi:glycosyltransferase involved in cell wall biosynthesis